MMDSRHDAAAYTAADVSFHIGVARASLNPLLPTLLAPLATLIVRGMFESHGDPDAVLSRASRRTPTSCARSKKRDPAAARRAMAVHLRESRQSFPRSWSGRARPGPPWPGVGLARQGRAPLVPAAERPSGLTTWLPTLQHTLSVSLAVSSGRRICKGGALRLKDRVVVVTGAAGPSAASQPRIGSQRRTVGADRRGRRPLGTLMEELDGSRHGWGRAG